MNDNKVRVRFAPSPTGPLHIGGLRTALFNYLFAKKFNGDFILRIEDTDQTRYVPGAEQYIIDSLNWCNIAIDEGVGVGGPFSPYRQSERKAIYREYVQQLVRIGKAYYAFDTPEDLESMRLKLQDEKNETQQYNHVTRVSMKNSFTLTTGQLNDYLNNNVPYVIRLDVPANENIDFTDKVYGPISFNTSQLDDKILYKSDGMPTYHLANVVDDHLMEITHVIRGSEWINSTPIHLLLYKSFGWEPPAFAHLPLILKPSGKGKLSKRDGDEAGFPVFPLQWTNPFTGEKSSGFRESGYFSDAFINILVLLGWNSGTDKEIMSLQEMTDLFSIENIGKSGARFDPDKARWFNHQYLQNKQNSYLATQFYKSLTSKGITTTLSYVNEIIPLIKERANFINDFWEHSIFFFQSPVTYDEKLVRKKWKPETYGQLRQISKIIESATNFSESCIETLVKDYIEKNGFPFGNVLIPLRICIVGSGSGPSLFKIISLIGRTETLFRIEKALVEISKQ